MADRDQAELANAREAILLDYLERRRQRNQLAPQGVKAVALAPTLEICRGLLGEERIHWTRLHPKQAERYGIRDGHRRPDDGRYTLADFNDIRR